MKKFLYECLFLSLTLLVSGCGKEEPIEPIVSSKPIIEVTISPETVNQGGSSTLIYSISNATNITLNGELITKMVDTLVYNDLQAGKVFDFEAKNVNGTTTLNKKITVVPLQPKLPSLTSLTADPQTLPVGGGITTISWTSKNSLSVEYGGITYPPNGSLPINVVSDSTNLVFTAIGTDGQRRDSSILIRVKQEIIVPIPIDHQYLAYAGWAMFKLERNHPTINPDLWEAEDISHPSLQDDRMYFTLNPKKMTIDYGELRYPGQTNFISDWDLNGDTFSGFAPTRTKIVLDWTTLIWTYEQEWVIFNPDGSVDRIPEIIRITYHH